MWIFTKTFYKKYVWGQKSSPQKTEYLIECYDR